jgi:hypothetical protein
MTMRNRSLVLATLLCCVPVTAIAAVAQLEDAEPVAKPTKARGKLVSWQHPGKSPVSTIPKFLAKISDRSPDPNWTAKLKVLDAKKPLSLEGAAKIAGKAKVGAWSFAQTLGPYQGTRGQIQKAGLFFDVCIDWINPQLIAAIIQEGAHSGVVKFAKGGEAELHLPAVGGTAAVRFNVDPSTSWSVQVDGAPESFVTVKSGAPESVVSIDLAVDLASGSPSQYTTVRLKALGDSNLYNTEIAIAEFH